MIKTCVEIRDNGTVVRLQKPRRHLGVILTKETSCIHCNDEVRITLEIPDHQDRLHVHFWYPPPGYLRLEARGKSDYRSRYG